MAKKKIAKKKVVEGATQEPMSAKEIKHFQKLLADIGSRKSRGVVYIIQSADKLTKKGGKEGYMADGVLLINKMSASTVVSNLVQKLEISPLHLLMMAGYIGHSHD